MALKTLVFVDGRITDLSALQAGLPVEAAWFVLRPEEDGLVQIARVLAGWRALDAIHLVSHGAAGVLRLGSTVLAADSLTRDAQALSALGAALAPGGDLLLYGCEVAQGPDGDVFLERLAAATGADVAASTDLTGLTGNWLLEARTGPVEAPLIDASQTGFAQTLANAAPVLAAGTRAMSAISENDADPTGQTVASILGTSLSDADAGALQGLALTATTGSQGLWQYRTDASAAWVAVGSVSTDSALLLRATDFLRWLPDGSTGTTATLTYVGWDQTTGSAGARASVATRGGTTAFSSTTASASLSVTSVNDAPVLSMGVGKLNTPIGSGDDRAYGSVVQPDGKIILVGASHNGADDDFAVVRYLADGTPDTGFSGDGKLTTSFGTGAEQAQSVALQADGKILVAGSAGRFALARYLPDGSLDTSFSGDGLVTTDPVQAGYLSSASAMAVQADGKIVVAGTSHNGSNNDFAVVRYNPDGTLDTSFSGDGLVTTPVGSGHDVARSMALQPDGKIVVAGYSDNGTHTDFALVRYNTNGTLDTSFSGDGKLTTDFSTGNDYGYTLALQADGKIVVAGQTISGASISLAAARYTSSGNLDTSFATSGRLISSALYVANSVALQPDGKLLLAGSHYGEGGQYNLAVTRFFSTGTLDTSFDLDGRATTDLHGAWDYATDVKLLPDGRILAAGHGSNGLNADFALVRYNADGSLAGDLPKGPVAFMENGAPVRLNAGIEVADVELSLANSFAGARVTLMREGGWSSEDLFSAMGSLRPLTQGQSLILGALTLGTVTQNNGGRLTLTFDGNVSAAQVNSVVQSIAYANSSEAPPASVAITWTFSDGNTGSQGSGGALVATGRTEVQIVGTNDAPTGTVSITGTLRDGETLTAVSTVADPDGRATPLSYQWLANGVAIAGAMGSSYLLTASEVGKTITVAVSYTDGLGKTESVASAATVAVGRFNARPSGSLSVEGTAVQGQTLTAASTVQDADGMGPISWQWLADGQPLAGATGASYVLGQADVGRRISVTASYTDGQGLAESVTSAASAAVTNVNDAPTGSVTLSGTARQLQVLTASHTVADVDGIPTSGAGALRYQWYAGETVIAGASGSTLSLTQAHVGQRISVAVLYTDNFGTAESVRSAATVAVQNVNDAPIGTVRVTGLAAQGQMLSASNTLADADGLGMPSYQWQADGVDLPGATDSVLTLTQAHVGRAIRVGVSYVDAYGTAERVFSTDSVVANVNDAPVLQPSRPLLTAIGKDGNVGQTAASLLGSGISDVDPGALQGVAIFQATGPAGQWQYSLNGGTSWTAFGAVSTSSALLLRGTDRVRWLSDTGSADLVTLGFHAWDQSSGSAAGRASVLSRGGSTAFSEAGDVATSPGPAAGPQALLQDNQGGAARGPVVYTLALGEPVQGLDVGDIVATGGTVGAFQALTDRFYQFTVTPAADSAGVIRVRLAAGAFTWAGGQASAALEAAPQYFYTRTALPDTLTVPSGTIYSTNQARLISPVNHEGSVYYYVDRIPTATTSSSDLIRGNLVNTDFASGGFSLSLPSATELTSLFQNAFIPTGNGGWTGSGNRYWSSTTGYYAGERSAVVLGGYSNGQATMFSGTQGVDGFLTYRVSLDQAIYPVFEATVLHERHAPELSLGFVLHKASASRLTVPLSLGGTATLGQDYAVSGSYLLEQGVHYLVFEPGSTLAQLRITAVQDALAEGAETLTLQLQGGTSLYVSQPSLSLSLVGSELVGQLRILGTARQGQVLGAANELREGAADGPAPQVLERTWLADGQALPDAGEQLTLTQALVGKTVALRLRLRDSHGDDYTVTQTLPAAVANLNDAPTGSVRMDGVAMQGQTLQASHSLADADGLGEVSYQWLADGVVIEGATDSRYTPTQAQVGKVLTVLARYTDAQGTAEAVASDRATVVANVNDPPTGRLEILGSPVQGQTLEAGDDWTDPDGRPPAGQALAYQWQAGGTDIAGANGPLYTLTQADVGRVIGLVVRYVDGFGHEEQLASAATGAVVDVNDPPEGLAGISGTPAQGRTLLANLQFSDPDGIPAEGPGAPRIQWQAGGIDIPGATGSSYRLTQAEVGLSVRLSVSYVDAAGHAERLWSEATAPVVDVNDPPAGSVRISGTPQQGQTLEASHTLFDPDGMVTEGDGALHYQWQAGGVPIAGATGARYTLTQAEVGQAITVLALYTDGLGAAEAVASAPTAAVANVNDPPAGSLAISGSPLQGQWLTAQSSLSDADGMSASGPGAPHYQWMANGSPIQGATGPRHLLTQADVGRSITVSVSYTDLHGATETVTSSATAAVANVNDAPGGAVRITGEPVQGQTLVVSHTLTDLDGLPGGSVRYQWQAGGMDIAGATGERFVPTQAQVGLPITVRAAYTDGFGHAEQLSSPATAAVANVNDPPVAAPASVTVDQGATATGNLAGSDADGDDLRFVRVTDPVHGTLSLDAATGRYSYQAASGHQGADSFSYKVNDGRLDSAVVTVPVLVRDTTPPRVGTFEPADGAQAVSPSARLAIGFTEAVLRGSGELVLRALDGTTVARYAADSGLVQVSGAQLMLQPAQALAPDTEYRLELAADAVRDTVGNSLAGGVSFGFRTAAAPAAQAGVVFWKDAAKTPGPSKLAEAVSLTDAIQILRMIVGLPINSDGTPVSPYQALAADFSQNGIVGLEDAIGVLKHVVGLSAPVPTWHYLDADKLRPASGAADAMQPRTWVADALLDATALPAVRVVGVLAGDVDGSWVG